MMSLTEEYNTFQVGLGPKTDRPPWGPISRWEMGRNPLWVNFSDPTILNLGTNPVDWDNDPKLADLAVVSETNANTPESWIYLMVTATKFPFGDLDRPRLFVPAAHPVRQHPFLSNAESY